MRTNESCLCGALYDKPTCVRVLRFEERADSRSTSCRTTTSVGDHGALRAPFGKLPIEYIEATQLALGSSTKPRIQLLMAHRQFWASVAVEKAVEALPLQSLSAGLMLPPPHTESVSGTAWTCTVATSTPNHEKMFWRALGSRVGLQSDATGSNLHHIFKRATAQSMYTQVPARVGKERFMEELNMLQKSTIRGVSDLPEPKTAIAPIHETSDANIDSTQSKSTAGVKKNNMPHMLTGTR